MGVTFHGENGSLLIDGDGYTVYDLKGAQVEEVKTDPGSVASQVGPAVRLDSLHTINFCEGIRGTATLATPIDGGHVSTMMAHLGNIAWRAHQTLTIDSTNGRIVKNSAAEKLWKREYRKGWEPKVPA